MTLVELMIVVAIVGVMSAVAIFAMGRNANAKNAAALARRIQFEMQRARVDAVSDNKQRELSCDATLKRCSYYIADAVGMKTQTFTTSGAVDKIEWGRLAQVYNITTQADVGVDNSGSKMSGIKNVIFYPNGTATAGTVYVSDTNATKESKYKIFIYPGTGMARLVDQW